MALRSRAISSLAAKAGLLDRRFAGLALLEDVGFGWRELGVAAPLLWLVGIVVYGVHVVHGGLYSDDWSLGALYRFPTSAGHVQDFLNISPARPVLALWLLMTYAVFGLHPAPQLALALLLGLLASTLFYAVLRTLGIVRGWAWMIAAMSLLLPISDADKLWWDASPGLLSVMLCCAGLLLMLSAFERRGAQALMCHGLGLAFYALSIMTYELTAPLIAVSACLLAWRRAPRRAVLRRTAVDVVTTLLILKFVTSQTSKTSSFAIGVLWAHAKAILNQGSLVLGESFFPFYSVPEHRLVLTVMALIALAGVVVWRRLADSDRDRALLGDGLRLAGAGLLVALLGWVILLPANIVYSPNAGGDGTRVNAVAAFGIAICVFGLLLIACVLVFRGLGNSRRNANAAALVAGALVAIGYAHLVIDDIHKWDYTNSVRNQVLASIRRAVPQPASGSLILATGFSQEPYDNIGTFDFPWDLLAATQLIYNNPSITAQPVVAATDLRCGHAQLTPLIAIGQVPSTPVAYGSSLYFVNTASGAVRTITSRSVCRAVGGTLG